MRVFLYALFCCVALCAAARAQVAPSPSAAAQDDDVVRVRADLVQTDVMVFDKQGRFVDDLKPEQFELQVDGRPQAIAFFERIMAGTYDEDAQLAAARGGSLRPSTEKAGGGGVRPLDRGRTVIFFVDDLHLAADSVKRTRNMLLRFVNEEMGQNDQAVVSSASGQIGFLQQLTGEKQVLRKAIELINFRSISVRDNDQPPMTENQAIAIERRDPQVVDFFVDQLIRQFPELRSRRDTAESMVLTRASHLVRQANYISINTLSTLEGLVRSSERMPGRKVVFFISDGFFMQSNDSQVRDKMRHITDAAARAGVVIYSLDARGLTPDLADATTGGPFDPGGQLTAVDSGERTARQDPLFTLAADTGGRALVNTNALNVSLTKALKETSVYYLLAWRPEQTDRRDPKFRRIEVSIKGRPDLKLMVRRGFFDVPLAAVETKRPKESKNKNASPKTSDGELIDALRAPFPYSALPTALSLGFMNAPSVGTVLTASLEIDNHALDYSSGTGQQNARADVIGAVLDHDGKLIHSFKQELSVVPQQAKFSGANERRIVYSNRFALKPGLYQVRVAARDLKSGRKGSASEWIEIPDIGKGKFSLSSIFVGERIDKPTPTDNKEAAASGGLEPVLVNAARRFARDSRLRFILHIYNATKGSTEPDVALQVQLFRDDQPIVTTPLRKLTTEGFTDLTRIPYAAEINLDRLPTGRYVLQVTAIDRVAKQSASQQINFLIE